MSNILITGCRGGIGLESAKRLVHKGHIVYAAVHKAQDIGETKAAFLPEQNVEVFKLDILDENDRQIAEELPIDVLINNAAIGDSGPLADISIHRIKSVFETNLFATLELTQIVLKNMIARGSGRVLFIGSIAGLIPMPFLAPYSSSKFALEGVVHAMRNETKPFGVDVVMINPGGYHTGFNQKNISKKYEWMDQEKYTQSYLELIKRQEKMLELTELKTTISIARKIVKAVQAKRPRKSYSAPLFQRLSVPLVKLIR